LQPGRAAPGRVRRRLAAGLALVGIVAAIGVALVRAWQERPRLPQADPIPYTDVNPYGANFFLDREVEAWKQARTLEMARAAGIGWIKQQFSWEEIEPRRKGEFDWAKYDAIVDLAERYGMEIVARLDRPPAWARPGNPLPGSPPDDPADYGDFVYAFVQHYRGRIHFIQIWNEPNLSAEWGFQRVDAVAYTALLKLAYGRAKEVDPQVVVLSAPLAITLEDASMRGNHNDLVFLEEMYRAGAGDAFDILSANAFGLDRPPEDPPARDVLNFRRVELQREIMERYGDADKPVWIDEYGWNAAPATFPDELLTWERVSPGQQADYTVRGIAWARHHWPWLGVVHIWYFRQVGDVAPDRAAYYFGLVDPAFNPTPAYDALRQVAQEVRAADAGLHQETSRAVSGPGWRWVPDPEASACGLLMGGDDAEALTFRFQGPRVALVAMQGPEEGRLGVLIDGQAVEGLAVDGEGRSIVDLEARRTRKQAVIALAAGLGDGPHALTLSVVGKKRVAVDGFLVSDESRGWPWLVAWACCGGLVVAGVGLWMESGRYERHG
jgi:hypothetical protein